MRPVPTHSYHLLIVLIILTRNQLYESVNVRVQIVSRSDYRYKENIFLFFYHTTHLVVQRVLFSAFTLQSLKNMKLIHNDHSINFNTYFNRYDQLSMQVRTLLHGRICHGQSFRMF